MDPDVWNIVEPIPRYYPKIVKSVYRLKTLVEPSFTVEVDDGRRSFVVKANFEVHFHHNTTRELYARVSASVTARLM